MNHFHYTLRGNHNRPLILLLHGFLGSGEDFDQIVPMLIEQFCCLTIDLPGHGKTIFSGDYTMQNTASAIVTLLDDLEIAQTHLIGYSMGGRLALYLALNFPNRFSKAILESASPGLKTEAEQVARIEHDRALARRLETDFPQFLQDWYQQPLFRSFKHHPTFGTTIAKRSRNNPSELAKSLTQMSTGMQPSLWQELKRHQNPLLLMVGECDRKFVAINQEMVALCSTAQLAIVPNVGHNVHIENANAYIHHIQKFLN